MAMQWQQKWAPIISFTMDQDKTTAPVAGCWAGAVMSWAGAIMIWAGAVLIWAGACSNTKFPTLKMPKNAKKAKCDRPTDRQTDRRTDRRTDRHGDL